MTDSLSAADASLLSAILDNAVDAIILIDERGTVLSANPATERLFGYRVDEVVGRNVKLLMPEPYHGEHDSYLANYRRTGHAQIIGIGREAQGRRADGTTFPLHLAVNEIQVETGRFFAGVIRDISDLKAVQQQLADLNEQLDARLKDQSQRLEEAQAELVRKEKLATMGQVSAGIAHEIRNPLNAVRTSAYFLLNANDLPREKIREHLNRIDRQVGIIDNVITALTDVARMPEPQFREVSVSDVIADALGSVPNLAGIEIERDWQSDLPTVAADDQQLPIVFRNLVRNARDAMQSSPRDGDVDATDQPRKLTISADADEAHVRVDVRDTGCGISPEQLTNIFEPFFSTKARGMGLGLAISKKILEKNGATLEVDSEPGVGTQFRVRMQRWSDEHTLDGAAKDAK